MRIAIADDCNEDLEILKQYIYTYFKNNPVDIDTYTNGEEFINNFEPSKYSLVFLDIYMNEISGINIARKIFEADKQCKIVFVTTSNSFAAESYEVEALGYIIKPVNKANIDKILDKCLADLKNEDIYLDLVSLKYSYHIAYNSIVYADTVVRTVRLHLTNDVIELKEGFYEKMSPLLEDNRFLECCRGVIVNMEHIIKIQGDDFIMDNGDNVPIRKRNKKEIHRAYMKYKISKL